MTGLTVALRQEKLRNIILDILYHKDRATAREIAFDLQVHDVWKSPREIASVILQDPRLKKHVDINWQYFGGWQRLTFSLRRDYNAPR